MVCRQARHRSWKKHSEILCLISSKRSQSYCSIRYLSELGGFCHSSSSVYDDHPQLSYMCHVYLFCKSLFDAVVPSIECTSDCSLSVCFPDDALVFEVQKTMLSPQLLVERGVAVSEVLHEAGEIVVTFPAAHFAVIDLGKKPTLLTLQ